MIWDILAWIGLVVCIIGASTIILLGLMVIRDWALQNIYDWKLTNFEESCKHQEEMVAVIHLRKLKKAYPELEITFNDKEIK